jgi:hypothetical protein
MAFFPDLSPYCYDDLEPRPAILNVGWLSKDHPFTRGSVPDAFLSALRRLAESPTELYRGKHPCEFCVPPDQLRSGDERFNWSWERAGNGEIRVPGDSGITYAAPVLIVHYVSEHQYQPPQEFIEAVLRFQGQLK